MYRALLALAKDNWISVNHATNKSKGAGTLSVIIKKLSVVENGRKNRWSLIMNLMTF